jgi:cytochrome c-type biogenesis protein CcmH
MLLLYSLTLVAATEQYPFVSAAQRTDFNQLTHELRCLVCQNQDLADSNAPLAVDLRAEIYQMIKRGESKQSVINYMTARYGDFVLYKTPLKSTTYVLWLSPFAMLLLAFSVLIVIVRRRYQRMNGDS